MMTVDGILWYDHFKLILSHGTQSFSKLRLKIALVKSLLGEKK